MGQEWIPQNQSKASKMYSSANICREGWHKRYDAYEKMLEAFVQYYNCEQPAYALNYKSPLQYKTEMGFYNLFALSTLC